MHFSIKVKVGLYAALVSVIALALMPVIMSTYIYHRQLMDLDTELKDDATEIFTTLAERAQKGDDPRSPLIKEDLPESLRRRALRIWNLDGSEIYRSKNWAEFEPRTLNPGNETIVIKGINCRVFTTNKDQVALSVGTRLGTLEGMQEDLRFAFGVALPVVALLVGAGVFLIARRSFRPIAKMTAAAELITAIRPKERLPVPESRDEIERLSRVLNKSFDRLEKAYAASERFASAASHQFKTPLTILRGELSELRKCDYLKPAEIETVESLLHETRRLTTLCEDLLLLAQVDAGRLTLVAEPLDLIPSIRCTIDDVEVLGLDANLTVDHDLPLELIAKADPRSVGIVLQNLGDNAVKYNRPNGKVRITARAEKGNALVAFASTGHCIATHDIERIFERFNRGKTGENIKGHGLGLSIARELARAHGGDLRLARSDAEWTEFELILPLAEDRGVISKI